MDNRFINIKPFGDIYVDRIFFEVNEPILFSCCDSNNNLFLAVCCTSTNVIKNG